MRNSNFNFLTSKFILIFNLNYLILLRLKKELFFLVSKKFILLNFDFLLLISYLLLTEFIVILLNTYFLFLDIPIYFFNAFSIFKHSFYFEFFKLIFFWYYYPYLKCSIFTFLILCIYHSQNHLFYFYWSFCCFLEFSGSF